MHMWSRALRFADGSDEVHRAAIAKWRLGGMWRCLEGTNTRTGAGLGRYWVLERSSMGNCSIRRIFQEKKLYLVHFLRTDI